MKEKNTNEEIPEGEPDLAEPAHFYTSNLFLDARYEAVLLSYLTESLPIYVDQAYMYQSGGSVGRSSMMAPFRGTRDHTREQIDFATMFESDSDSDHEMLMEEVD